MSGAIGAMAFLMAAATFGARSGEAAETKTLQLSDGTEITYALVLPAGFKAESAYPALLVFAGGPQTMNVVSSTLRRFWESEAYRRGLIVVAPAAPTGQPFFEDGVAIVAQVLRHIPAAYPIKDGKFHLGGQSNGGVSAFRAAIRYPELFNSLTVLAGFPENDEDFERLDRVKDLKISLFVGDGDVYWRDGMARTVARLLALGKEAYFEIIPRNGHFLPDLSPERLFDRIGR